MTGVITEKSLRDDIQASTNGFYEKGIAKVGTRGTRIPFTVKKKNSDVVYHTLASVSSYCSLDAAKKGINMSRIARTITEVIPEFADFEGVKQSVKLLKQRHESDSAWIKVKFEYAIENKSPMSKEKSFEPVYVEMESKIDENNNVRNFLTVEKVVMSLCPCSKNMSMLKNNLTNKQSEWIELFKNAMPKGLYNKIMMSGFGAHNQKSVNRVTVELKDDVDGNVMWIEDMVELIDHAGSAPTYTVLKRVDEKYLTEVSYLGAFIDDDGEINYVAGSGAKFVEDISRDISKALDKEMDKRITDYVIVTENQESIHSGDISAIAILNAGKELD